ncbi:MAG TPA: Omp28-related outer membrane protein [Candidatus Kapabacteria bacterium]|nr:Omp28-related outer membrane protein [Candidatus Kapabacteria bacterium]
MKRLLLFASLVLAVTANTASAQAPTKKVLLEEFTGSWCGWCPRGIWAIEQLEQKYPNTFIPVAFHNSDPMQIPTGQDTLESTITGYPEGWVDRLVQPGNTRNLDPTQFDSAITAHFSDPVQAGVTITNVTFDPRTRVMTATINATFTTAVTGDLRLNCYLIEDSCSGPAGTTWDQHNYLTNRSGYQDNPFFNLPAVVPSYQHMHVVRAVLGGAWGTAGVIPATAVVGTKYSVTYTYTVLPNVKPDQTKIVGFVSSYGTTVAKNKILNAETAPLTTLPLITGFSATGGNAYITATRSGVTDQIITLSNSGNAPLTASLTMDATSTSLPASWKASLSSSSVTIPAKSSITDTLAITAPAKAGFASVFFTVLPVSDAAVAHPISMNTNALSAGTKYVSYGSDGFMPTHMDTKYSNDFAAVPLNTNVLAAYKPETFDVSLYPGVAYFDYTNLAGVPPAVVPSITASLNAGKKVFITSTYGLYYEFDPASGINSSTNTQAAQDLFNTKLAISYLSLNFRYNQSTGQAVTTSVTGFPGDPVGNGIVFNCGFYQSDVFSVDDQTHTKPVIYFDDDQTVLGGFRYDNGSGQRLVYLDLDFSLVGSGTSTTNAKKLVTQSMDFLINGVNAVKPSGTAMFSLDQNYPNPVSGDTKITYSLGERAPVSLVVTDMLGRQVAQLVNTTQDASSYSLKFDGSTLPSGVYTYTLTAGDQKLSRTLNVVK